MSAVYIILCIAPLIAGLCRGKPWPPAHSFEGYLRTLLFWVAVTGVVAVIAALAAILGIAAVFNESTDSHNVFDDIYPIGKQTAVACAGLSGLLLVIMIVAKPSRTTKGDESSPARNDTPPRA
jgi:hypothetical protein